MNTNSEKPYSYITSNKFRLQNHLDSVYLNYGDRFEIWVRNPSNKHFLVMVEHNGIDIGKNFTLKPYEATYIESENFLYDEDGGDVVIKFFKEIDNKSYTNNTVSFNEGTSTRMDNTWHVNMENNSTTWSINYDTHYKQSFENMTNVSQWWKIKPIDESLNKEDLTIYCMKCDSKKSKHTYKFCPHCGERL